jgi:S-adenosylmethionine/arginine decarboxylase-like enzyme
MAVIDLHDADRERLADPDTIRAFTADVIGAIGMVAHGPTMLERFGEGDLEGWSALQFIETSSLTIHADEVGGRCYIDVFSCKAFDPELAAGIAASYFGGWPKLTVLHR